MVSLNVFIDQLMQAHLMKKASNTEHSSGLWWQHLPGVVFWCFQSSESTYTAHSKHRHDGINKRARTPIGDQLSTICCKARSPFGNSPKRLKSKEYTCLGSYDQAVGQTVGTVHSHSAQFRQGKKYFKTHHAKQEGVMRPSALK